MTSLQVRLAFYVALLLLLVGGGFGWGHHSASTHYIALIAADKAAQDAAVLDAQRKVIASQQAQDEALRKAEDERQKLVASDASVRDSLTQRLRDLTAALHSRTVSTAVDVAGQPPGSAPVPGSAEGIERSITRTQRAAEAAIAACQSDAETLSTAEASAPH